MFIVRNRAVFYSISGILCVAALVALFAWGLKPGIDFTGGSIVEVAYDNASSTRPVVTAESLGLEGASIRETGSNGFIIRAKELTPEEHNTLLAELGNPVEKRFDSVGPILGKEALQKSWMSIGLVLLAIVLFITFVFRRVSRPVSSWKYGLIAIVGLAHNILIAAGAFALFGHLFGFEIDTLFVTALLVILGFSIHDTIVVFDRVRENLRDDSKGRKAFDELVGESVRATFVRSVNTSLTTLLAIVVLYLVGPEATKHFSLALAIGIAAGTYSSIFLCSPLLVSAFKWQGGNK
ncbi:MAG TPA: protein translocase subunit SecF [Candidatus Paceibacterota bacterium]|jgi:protein-export membrane protein SecF